MHSTTCQISIDNPDWQCPICSYAPEKSGNYYVLSPGLAQENDGFHPEYFPLLQSLEEKNFWFHSRNELIIWALKKYFSTMSSFLEIGCGTGFVLNGISKAFPNTRLLGSDIYTSALAYPAERVPQATLFQMDARQIPFANQFEVVGAFDVLEHIEEDEQVLAQIFRAVKPNGGIVLTIPQHPFLWSQSDDYACHKRRYTASEINKKLTMAGFSILKMTSFVSLLLPLMFFSRLRAKKQREAYSLTTELRINPYVNQLLLGMMALERQFIRSGIGFPMGGSLLVVAKKSG